MLRSILTEYGISWGLNRLLYLLKLKTMKTIPLTEIFYEKKVDIKQIDIYQIDVKRIESFLINLPHNDKQIIIQKANKAIDGKINAFSSIELDYGKPINWHLNPINGVELNSNKKWYNIPDFDEVSGDIKIIWEPSRFTHFFYFLRAYMITKDYKYYEAFSSQLMEWLKHNKYSFGANYKCGQEATLRMINVLITYSVFKDYKLTNEKDERNVKQIVEGSYKKVLSNFFYSYKCIKNNHTLSEITGLIIGAWCSKDDKSLSKAYKLMNKEIQQQFMEDGGYIQFSFNYQRFALQIMEFIFKISNTTRIELSRNSKKLIEKSALLMYQMQDKSGNIPNYGSNDGALIFPVTTCDYRDYRPVINSIYLTLKGERLYERGHYDEEFLWFSDIFDINNTKLPFSSISRKSLSFYQAGVYSFRHLNGHIIIILHNYKSRPAQMDQMHIDLWHKGFNVLCDSGTFSYASELGKKMSLTEAHNTVKIEKKEQMKKKGAFLIYNWTSTSDIEFDEYHFKGTMISKNGYTHTRVLNRIEDGYSIIDQVSGEFNQYKVLFHTPCDIKRNKNGIELFYEDTLLAVIVTKNIIQISETFRSEYYMHKETINKIIIIGDVGKKVETKIILIK